MLNDQRAIATTSWRNNSNNINNIQEEDGHHHHHNGSPIMRDIHAITPPISRSSHMSSSLSMASSDGENFTTISREFNALVLAGSRIRTENQSSNLRRIGEDQNQHDETNQLAIVLDTNPLLPSPRDGGGLVVGGGTNNSVNNIGAEKSLQIVKKEEVETKINAWQNGKIAKINNRFKREDAIINGWEGKQAHKATSWMKKVERKLEEKRAKALEKTQNEMAKAHRKAEERRASAEAKRGTKVARVMEIANFMRAMGRPPIKRSFF